MGIYLRNLRFIQLERNGAVARNWELSWLGLVAVAGLFGYYFGPDSATRRLILDEFWTVFGFVGQLLFTARFLVQWWATEHARRSVVPLGFWYLSIAGSLMLLAYAVAVLDPVIVLGQSFGLIVYLRNLILRQSANPDKSSLSTT